MRIEHVADLEDLGARAAAGILEICRDRQALGEIPCVVLTGGRAGAQLLIALRDHADRDTVDWRRVRLLWGDERWLPAGDSERNDVLADTGILGAVETDPSLVHRIAASDAGVSLDDAAAAYAAIVVGIERIDVAVNGVGEDGHVASLFPGRADLLATSADTPAAFAVRESPKPPSERVTLSVETLRRAARVWLFATGEGKAEAVRQLVARTSDETPLPAELITVSGDAVLWADDAALSGVHAGTR